MIAIFDLCYFMEVWSGPSMYLRNCSMPIKCYSQFFKFVFNIVPIIHMDVSIIKSHLSEWVGWCMCSTLLENGPDMY